MTIGADHFALGSFLFDAANPEPVHLGHIVSFEAEMVEVHNIGGEALMTVDTRLILQGSYDVQLVAANDSGVSI